MSYESFLASKRITAPDAGFEPGPISGQLFGFQAHITRWAIRKGCAAMFCATGTGKTAMQLEWARHIHAHTGGRVLILAPLAVAEQTAREGEKFGVPVAVCRTAEDLSDGINVTNYERLHYFDAEDFSGLVLDESSILKGFEGRFRRQVTDFGRSISYRLACTATPAPNDTEELANHAEFLGAMTGKEMLALFFTQDGNSTHKWRLKEHSRRDFWQWVASWAMAVRSPSDLGYDDGEFELPALTMHQLTTGAATVSDERLFSVEAQTLTERRAARRESVAERVERAAELVANEPDEPWLLWCGLNKESEALAKAIPDAVEVRGSDSAEHKTRALLDFAEGRIRVLVSKPSIAGHGMNFQRCARMVFVGLSDCYDESTEILTRRGWLSFGEVTTADEVATVNPETRAHEWQQPSKVVWEHYSGPMLHFSGQQNFDLLVTPNHKLFVDRCKVRYPSDTSTWQLRYAADLAENYRRQEYRMLSAPEHFEGDHLATVDVPIDPAMRQNSRSRLVRSIPLLDFMRLAGWYLSEGYCRPLDTPEAGRIVICQTERNAANRVEITALLKRLGLSVNDRSKDITAYSYNLAAYLVSEFGAGSYEKRIPQWVKELDGDALAVLRNTMLKGDGCHDAEGIARCYRTASKRLADDFQELCLKTSVRGSVSYRVASKGPYSGYGVYDVNIAWRHVQPSISRPPEEIDYDGMIGCVTVPNHTVIVRRNGVPVVSGNSFEEMYQATRRCWRFGQTRPVEAYVVTAEDEGAVVANIRRKEKQAKEMMEQIVEHTARRSYEKPDYEAHIPMQLPGWLVLEVSCGA